MPRPLRLFPVLLALVLLSLVPRLHGDSTNAEVLRTPADRPIDIQHIRLDLRVDLPAKTVDARATLQLKSLRPLTSLELDAVDFQVQRVTLTNGDEDGVAVRFTHDGKRLHLDLDPPWPAGKSATLRIKYKVREPKDGLYFFGPTASHPNRPWSVYSQGEPTLNRYWFPCLDQPNQRQTTELVVTVADGLEVVSNGKLIDRKVNADQTVTFHWREDKPHVAYLVTLVVGPFDVVREEWKGLPVLYYVPKGRKDEVPHTFGHTRQMLEFFTQRFGIDYPWEKYAQVIVGDLPGFEGMENTSASSLHESSLHDARAILDDSPDALIAHELAHQWWGDMVTCRDWTHLWLQEGFASLAEVLWAEHHDGPEEGSLALQEHRTLALTANTERPMVDRRWLTADDMFDNRAYSKGAWVLQMLRRQLGEDVFWKAVRQYGTDYRFQSVDTTDFRKVLERVSGRDLERFFYDWTERPGHPILEITTQYQPESKQVKVVVKQTQAGEAFQFPLTIAFHHSGGKVTTMYREVTEKEHTFAVVLPERPTVVDVDPEQALLAQITEVKGRDLWLAQLTDAPGVLARLRAVDHLDDGTAAEREALLAALPREKFWGVQVAIVKALGRMRSEDEAVRAALLKGLTHPHPKVRRAFVDQQAFQPDKQAAAVALKELLRKGDPSYLVEEAALRTYGHLRQPDAAEVLLPWLEKPSRLDALRCAALEGLGVTGDPANVERLLPWTERGKPEVCRVSALKALAELARVDDLKDEALRRILAALTACLEGDSHRVRTLVVDQLRELGRTAAPSVPLLQALAEHDPEEAVRKQAKEAIEQIRGRKVDLTELTRLREELERFKKAHEALQQRIQEYEEAERKRR